MVEGTKWQMLALTTNLINNEDLETGPIQDLLNTALSPTGLASAAAGRINLQETQHSSKVEPVAQIILTTTVWQDGPSGRQMVKQSSNVEATLYGTKCSSKTMQKAIDLHASLKSQGIDQPLTLRTKRGRPLVTIATANAPKAKLANVQEGIHAINKNAAPKAAVKQLATSDGKMVIIRDKDQLKEVLKYADRLGLSLDKILAPKNILKNPELATYKEKNKTPLSALPNMLKAEVTAESIAWTAPRQEANPMPLPSLIKAARPAPVATATTQQTEAIGPNATPKGMDLNTFMQRMEQSIEDNMAKLESTQQTLRPTLLDNYRALLELKKRNAEKKGDLAIAA